jgi:hypothetical protein
MRLKGVSYDVGRFMGFNWRPSFDPSVVHRELGIIRDDLHCNAVRICGLSVDRLMTAASLPIGSNRQTDPGILRVTAAKTQ